MKKFAITYKNFDENGALLGAKTTKRTYTKREAIAHLQGMGFSPASRENGGFPFKPQGKLPSIFFNGSFTAYIVSAK